MCLLILKNLFRFSWAFGVFLWEMWSLAEVPYPCVDLQDHLAYLLAGNRLTKPEAAPEEM